MGNIMLIKLGLVVSTALVSACAQDGIEVSGSRDRQASSNGITHATRLPRSAPVLAVAAGVLSGEAGEEPAGGQCAHGICETGNLLEPGCDPCVERVCAADASCCEEEWSAACVQYAGWFCGACGVEGCGGLPEGGACVGDFVLTCEGGSVSWAECAVDEACQWDEDQAQHACVGG